MKSSRKSRIRSLMSSAASNKNVGDCLMEVLKMEGFLPETISESETYDEIFTHMMEDDDVMLDMYNSMNNNDSSCGNEVKSWMNMAEGMRLKEGYDGFRDQEHEGSMYVTKLEQILEDVEEMIDVIPSMGDIPAWIQDKLTIMSHNADAIISYIRGEKKPVFEDEYKVKNKVVKASELFENNEDGMVESISYPVKGASVDSQNKKNSKDSENSAINGAKVSQKVKNEKADNLKNQKYELNDWELKVDEVIKGWRNNLDVDYENGVSKEQSDKIKDEASGLAPKDHANVDHESKAGNFLLKAAQLRSQDPNINDDDYTSSHNRTQLEPKQTRTKGTIFKDKK
jgi:hypothetical protein